MSKRNYPQVALIALPQKGLQLIYKSSTIIYDASPYFVSHSSTIIQLIELERKNNGNSSSEKRQNANGHIWQVIFYWCFNIISHNGDDSYQNNFQLNLPQDVGYGDSLV